PCPPGCEAPGTNQGYEGVDRGHCGGLSPRTARGEPAPDISPGQDFRRSSRQKPCPNGSLQNAADPCAGLSKFCSTIAPAATALSSASARFSTWKSRCTGVQCRS